MEKRSIFLVLCGFACSALTGASRTIDFDSFVELKSSPLSCSLQKFNKLDKAFADISFADKVKRIKELIILRTEGKSEDTTEGKDDAKILKKIELLLCSTDLLRSLPQCVNEDLVEYKVLSKSEDTFVASIEAASQDVIAIDSSRYEILRLAILYRFKDLIEFIYQFVSPLEITDVASNTACSDTLLNDLEILLEEAEYRDIEDMLDFLLKFRSLKELKNAYPDICRAKQFSSAVVNKGCLLIDKEIEQREEAARKKFSAVLDELSEPTADKESEENEEDEFGDDEKVIS